VDESSLQAAAGSYRVAAGPPAISGGGTWRSGPDAAAASSNSVDVFARGPDDALWQTHWNGSAFSGTYTSLGGTITADPGAVASGSSRTDVFVRGSDNQLYQKTWNGTAWSAWKALGGRLTTGPDASLRAGTAPHVDVWVAGSDSQLYHRWSDDGGNTFAPWQALGGVLTSDPRAVSWSPNRRCLCSRQRLPALSQVLGHQHRLEWLGGARRLSDLGAGRRLMPVRSPRRLRAGFGQQHLAERLERKRLESVDSNRRRLDVEPFCHMLTWHEHDRSLRSRWRQRDLDVDRHGLLIRTRTENPRS